MQLIWDRKINSFSYALMCFIWKVYFALPHHSIHTWTCIPYIALPSSPHAICPVQTSIHPLWCLLTQKCCMHLLLDCMLFAGNINPQSKYNAASITVSWCSWYRAIILCALSTTWTYPQPCSAMGPDDGISAGEEASLPRSPLSNVQPFLYSNLCRISGEAAESSTANALCNPKKRVAFSIYFSLSKKYVLGIPHTCII